MSRSNYSESSLGMHDAQSSKKEVAESNPYQYTTAKYPIPPEPQVFQRDGYAAGPPQGYQSEGYKPAPLPMNSYQPVESKLPPLPAPIFPQRNVIGLPPPLPVPSIGQRINPNYNEIADCKGISDLDYNAFRSEVTKRESSTFGNKANFNNSIALLENSRVLLILLALSLS